MSSSNTHPTTCPGCSGSSYETKTTTCSRCFKEVPETSINPDTPEAGATLALFGYYNGFYDPFESDELVKLDICHSCVLELIQWLKLSQEQLQKFSGGHPTLNQDNTACCEYSWIPVYENNKWVGTTDITGQIRYHES